jgi:hypothetical protein
MESVLSEPLLPLGVSHRQMEALYRPKPRSKPPDPG